jgi:hypothetical protein
MLFLTVELVAMFAVGFVLGRMWETRQRLIRTEVADEPLDLIVSNVTSQTDQFPRDDRKLLRNLDRELRTLLEAGGVQKRRNAAPGMSSS